MFSYKSAGEYERQPCSRSATRFLFELIARLQQVANAPIIDGRAYAPHIPYLNRRKFGSQAQTRVSFRHVSTQDLLCATSEVYLESKSRLRSAEYHDKAVIA